MGVQGGTNGAAVDDADGVLGGTDSERWEYVLGTGFGLTNLEFIFTRATPIVLSGFISDPQASVDAAAASSGVVTSYSNGTLTMNHLWRGGAITDLVFANPGASSGQTITLRVADAAQAAPQAAIYAFEWDAASPVFAGDVDGDGDVDLTDFGFIRDNWFNGSSPTRAMGDLNGDGIVEFDDFAEWKTEFPFPLGGDFATGFHVIPEPASVVLVGAALLGFGLRRPRRHQERINFRSPFPMLASMPFIALLASPAEAQLSVDFENPPYISGTIQNQDGWVITNNAPRVQTGSQISSELVAAGLNAGTTVQSGTQALLVTANPGETTNGGFARSPFTGLESESQVAMEWWARPLTAGAVGSTIGTELGNTFIGLQDTAGTRAAAVRFGVVRDETNAIIGNTIDFASATAGSAVWVPSGLTWAADTWYNFRFELDYTTKQYDFFIDDTKVNTSPIQFYNISSVAATNVFISRGAINAGQIIDDISVDHDLTKKLLLSITPSDGNAVLKNNTAAAIILDSYSIASVSNSLLTSWGSLTDQSMAGWEEAVPSTGRVSELNPAGSLTLNPGQSIMLNGLWNTAGPQNAADLMFTYRNTASGPTQVGAVEFASANLPGDFDGDGDVDGRDFLTWQRNPSVGSLSDWQNNYGNPGAPGLAAIAAVPEPSAGLLAITCGFAAIATKRSFRAPA
jgi:hypothetical protein